MPHTTISEPARQTPVIHQTDVLVAALAAARAGVEVTLLERFVAPILGGHTITGVIVESKQGREAILA